MWSAAGIEAMTQGWVGLAMAYGAVQVPMLAGLLRSRAAWDKWLASPVVALPMTLAAGLGMAAASPLFQSLGMDSAGLARTAIGAAVCIGGGYGAGRLFSREERVGPRYQRGAIVQTAGAPAPSRRTVFRADPGRVALRERAITLAGIPLNTADETKHFKLIGTTGTGKSTAIAELLAGALGRGDRAVIADPDGGYLRRFYDPARGDVILNPFDARSVKWDLFGEIQNPYDVEQIARSLIPDPEGSDRSWSGYARTFFTAVTRQAHAAGMHDLGELHRLLVMADTQTLRTLVRGTPAQPFLEEHNGRMFDSIRSVTSSAVGSLDYVAQQRAESFSVRQWVAKPEQERGGVLFIPYRAGQIAALRSTISAWMRIAVFEAMNQPEGDQRLWFVVDELDALGQIDGLKDALARLRKFGGRCVLGFQSVAQVAATYGAGEAHTIVENCGNSLILRCSASEGGGTARFASQLIGQREVVRTSFSASRRATEVLGSHTRSEHVSVESAVMDSQIEQLPDLHGYLKLASSDHWRQVALRVPTRAPAFAPTSALAALPDRQAGMER